MKRNILIIIFALVATGLLLIANFYWKNLRGALPAFRKPSKDIAELIEKSATTTIDTGNPKPADNKTEMSPGQAGTNLAQLGGPLKLPDGFAIYISDDKAGVIYKMMAQN